MRKHRPCRSDPADDSTQLEAQMLSFQHQRHSLRISVSNLAALVGFHPYKQVPELVLRLVYQGATGQALLQKDAALLGLVLVTPEEQLRELARKAGRATQAALARAFTATSDSVEAARVMKRAVVQEAKKTGRLQATELKILEEGARSAVDTQHGERHESCALDAYEQQTGWSVRMRNAEIRMLAFKRSDNETIPTVAPIGVAECVFHNSEDRDRDEDSQSGQAVKRPRVITLTDSGSISGDDEPASVDEDPKDLYIETTSDLPFLYLLGSIDGLRDELAPNERAQNDDDDSWILRPVVVECKHRMNRIHNVPPLYEQIQTVAYCFMYGAEHADIVQVMRKEAAVVRENPHEEAAPVNESTAPCQPALPLKNEKNNDKDVTDNATDAYATENEEQVSDFMVNVTSVDSMGENKDVPEIRTTCDELTVNRGQHHDQEVNERDHSTKPGATPLALAISRVSLDDPIYQHRTHWNQVILPRLRSIVDTIYDIRCDDAKRYQLLAVMSSQYDVVLEEAWQLIIAGCPWLEHCDTALHWNKTINTTPSIVQT